MSSIAILFVFAGLLLVLLAWILPSKEKLLQERAEVINTQVIVPEVWDEKLITREIDKYRDRPNVVSYFVSSVIDRFITGQDNRTAQARSQFLRSKIEQLKIAKELQTSIDDLRFHEIERQIRQLELDMKKQKLEDDMASQKELTRLRTEKEKLEINLQMAKMQKEMKELEKEPEPPPAKQTRAEWKAKGRARVEKEIEAIKQFQKEKLTTIEDKDERMLVENMCADRIRTLMEELKKYL